ncbi:MAG: hypothetical protein WC679_02525 [Bacteroidales bacterium]|jgi:hypothetical protein
MIEVIKGDLLKANCDVIAHQINCVSTGSAGFAQALFKKYPDVNVYDGSFKRIAGQNIYTQAKKDNVLVVHMAGQVTPRNVKYSTTIHDDRSARLKYFKSCIFDLSYRLSNEKDNLKMGMPYLIGCGLAGGHWPDYLNLLEAFNTELPKNITFNLYTLQ